MAITGPIYWNGTTFPSQSGDPVAITQTEFEDCCCEEGDPCTDCSGVQPSATVSFGSCTPSPTAPSGAYAFLSFSTLGPSACQWIWVADSIYSIYVTYNTTQARYTIKLGNYFGQTFGDLYCANGSITGTVRIWSTVDPSCYADISFG